MNRFTKILIASALTGGCLSIATPGLAVEVYLRADSFTATMPDGANIPMWGFAPENSTWTAGTAPTSPGPRIDIPSDSSGNTLVIRLKNDLDVPISLVIPNQNGFLADAPHATFVDSDGRTRARSFVKETAPGAIGRYEWRNVTPGTYLYHSGSHPALQVQMGLYGAAVRRSSASQVYTGIGVASETLLLLSEIDAEVHDAVANDEYGPGGEVESMIHSTPQYFLINGEAYQPGRSPIPAGYARETALLRLINAGYDYRAPVVGGLHQTVIAENGRLYPYARQLSAPVLGPLQTLDVLINSQTPGLLPFYDRCLGLVNGLQSPGGMFVNLAVGTQIAVTNAILIPGSGTGPGNGSPSPSSRVIIGLSGTVGKVTVTLVGFSHSRPQDVDVILVSPDNRKVMLMSDVGDDNSISSSNPVTLTFDDAAASGLSTAALVTGSYRPTDLDPSGDSDTVFSNLPSGPVYTSLSAFQGANPNGNWRLYTCDDRSGSSGRIAGGFILGITPQ